MFCGKNPARFSALFPSKLFPLFLKILFDKGVYGVHYKAVDFIAGRWQLTGKNSFNRWRGWRDSVAGLLDWGCGCFQTFVWAFPGGMGCKIRRVRTRLLNI